MADGRIDGWAFGNGVLTLIIIAGLFVISIWAAYFFRIPFLPLIFLGIWILLFIIFAFLPLKKDDGKPKEPYDHLWFARFFLLLFIYAGALFALAVPFLWTIEKTYAKRLT
ncbi:uncharacterized protein MONOS_17032 [Monocercomonoides exilis]|uniref:uncharacterized protein n=1 Tax=Monocercomonoides exilis TaxID=2049356 RepID=UPI00355A3DC9|nr:hypothetical protein MONOS_17032 [Monocercomonoides exilis]